jgi:hypothetical protein
MMSEKMTVKDSTHTARQAEELERALEAQYQADKRRPAAAEERADWRRTRRAAAEKRPDGKQALRP